MHIDPIIKCSIMNSLLAISVAGSAMAAADPQIDSTTVPDLNDSNVNHTLALYPFFVLEFYKSMCNPCGRMNAAINELSLELMGQAAFGRIDGTKNHLTAERYNVTSYPTLIVLDNGTRIDRSEGFASKKYIVDRLRRVKPDLNMSRVAYH